MGKTGTKTLLLVDDSHESRRTTRTLLESLGYKCLDVASGEQCLDAASNRCPDLLLLDVRMPGMTGFETARRFRERVSPVTPIVMLTALDDVETRVQSIQSGANDVLTKPTERALLDVRVRTLIEQQEKYDMLTSCQQLAVALIKAMETKSRYTSGHSRRVGLWAAKIARDLGLGSERVALTQVAGALHDVGKIGVPDGVLEKPAALTSDEMIIMRTHSVLGELILKSGNVDPIVIKTARNHHERMDGKGYPDGIPATSLPIEVRIVQVADVFDAITSRRPYSTSIAPARAIQILRSGADDGQLDGEIVNEIADLVARRKIYPAISVA